MISSLFKVLKKVPKKSTLSEADIAAHAKDAAIKIKPKDTLSAKGKLFQKKISDMKTKAEVKGTERSVSDYAKEKGITLAPKEIKGTMDFSEGNIKKMTRDSDIKKKGDAAVEDAKSLLGERMAYKGNQASRDARAGKVNLRTRGTRAGDVVDAANDINTMNKQAKQMARKKKLDKAKDAIGKDELEGLDMDALAKYFD